MAKNKIENLREHLFLALENLNDLELTDEQMEKEIKRADAVCNIASQLIQSAKIEVDYIKVTGQLSSTTSLFEGLSSNQKQLS